MTAILADASRISTQRSLNSKDSLFVSYSVIGGFSLSL
jgi:hypothetical protein